MLLKLVAKLPEGPEWLYEIKFDGFRAIAIKDGNSVQLRSRNDKDLSDDFPTIIEALRKLKPATVVLDGEIVALDDAAKASFQALQKPKSAHDIQFYAFDLLEIDGRETLALPLSQRKKLLERLLKRSEHPLRLSATLNASPEELVKAAYEQGLEGIVAKSKDSPYQPGERSGLWVKFKTDQEGEFIVCGYRLTGKNNDFDALVVGYEKEGELTYAAKVRSGFTPRQKKEIISATFPAPKMPFKNVPISKGGRWGEGLTEEDLELIQWVKPRLKVKIGFVEWTSKGSLRHAKFLGMRG